ncbi:MAG TPA: hypothetical protein VFN37_05570 [Candidatus Baltobacteraceae bacterium]|nr:hypothetical protein [Candidatus Baltobacteraceae bacterium]
MKRQMAAISMALTLACAAVAAAQMRDGAVIRNSGSTNFSGYTIKVWSDGSTWAVPSDRAGTAVGTPVNGHISAALAQTFLRDAQQARRNRVISEHCMKSASFGTVTTVLYHGWSSPDLECPGGGFVVALGADAHKIAAQLKIAGGRRTLLPNEPRRVPTEGTPSQASPTPEPATSPSY